MPDHLGHGLLRGYLSDTHSFLAVMRHGHPKNPLWLALLLIAAPLALLSLEIYQAAAAAAGSGAFYAAAAGAVLASLLLIGGTLSASLTDTRDRELSGARDSDQQFRLLVDGVTDYAIYMLDAQGYVTSWNPGVQRIKGYSAKEIIGEHYSRFFTEEDRKAGVPQQILAAAARDGRFEAEAWRVRKDGSRFYVNAVITALRDPSGALIGFAKVTRDITERVRQQQALEQAHAALAQSQKMEALGQLTGGIAHDFNNLLHIVRNSLTLVRDRIRDVDPESVKYLEMASRNAARASAVTQRLLAFARQQPLDPKPVAVNRLIQSMPDLIRHAVGEGIEVETVLSSGLWTVSVDVNQLETAILNLVLNSRDAMEGSGKLTIETGNALLDEGYAAAHTEVRPGQYVLIAVSDTGAGMSAEVAEKAFEPFFTTKQAGEGTGLGLSQVFGFVKQSGGHVKIYSELGEGTTVKIYLPRLSQADSTFPVQGLSTPADAKGERILVVEDNEDTRVFTAEMLRGLGYRVAEAPDAASALRLLDGETAIDLLFTDVALPGGMNGRQLADEACKRRPGLRVLYTTGYARNAIIHHGRLDPGVQLLTKPFTQLELARRVRQTLDAVPD
jgi:PAS domain S-box-containing protein